MTVRSSRVDGQRARKRDSEGGWQVSRLLYPSDWARLPYWVRALVCFVFGHEASPISTYCRRECGHQYDRKRYIKGRR